MDDRALKNILQTLRLAELKDAPDDDPRHTPTCLSFAEMEAVAIGTLELPANRKEHADSCSWCVRGLRHMRKLVTPNAASLQISHIDFRWPSEMTAVLAAWLEKTAAEELSGDEPTPAHFDSEGRLRVHCSDLDFDGPARVSLVWRGTEVPLIDSIPVRNGKLDAVQDVPHLGIRSLEIPASVLKIERLESETETQ